MRAIKKEGEKHKKHSRGSKIANNDKEKRNARIERIMPGDRIALRVTSIGLGVAVGKYNNHKVMAIVVKTYPNYILFDLGKYKTCALKSALKAGEAIFI